MNGRRLAVVLLTALALLAAGCGADGGGDEAAATTDTAIVEETETTDEDPTTTDDGLELEGECAEFAGLSARLQQALTGSGELDADAFDELADEVPEEIRDDYEVLAANFRELAEALEGIDLSGGQAPSAEDLAKLQELSRTFDDPEVQQAAGNIEAWARENC
jgi:hypothetical protein